MTEENDAIDVSVLFGDRGTVNRRTIPFNLSGVDIYSHLDDEGQELVIAGPPSDISQGELVEMIQGIFEYLVEVLKDESINESLQTESGVTEQ